jgi:hypothetical protein
MDSVVRMVTWPDARYISLWIWVGKKRQVFGRRGVFNGARAHVQEHLQQDR